MKNDVQAGIDYVARGLAKIAAAGGGGGGGSAAWGGITGSIAAQADLMLLFSNKADATHTHSAAAITDLDEKVYDLVADILVQGTNVSLTKDDVTNTVTVAASGGGSGAVSSVNTRTGAVTLAKSDVGLANVDNTSDNNKPVSTAQQTAIDAAKARSAHTGTQLAATISNFTAAVNAIVDPKLLTFRPETYGAVGNGSTNDTDAFVAMTTAINAADGGVIDLRPGATYVIGKQAFAGNTGLGYAYQPTHVMHFIDCARGVYIRGNYARLLWQANLKFGSFNPTTGNVHNPGSMPFTNGDYRADLGYTIITQNCGALVVTDLEIDGNQANMTLGGTWGDTGRQLGHYGIYSEGTRSFIQNVNAHHMCLDGFGFAQPGFTASSPTVPVMLLNCTSHYNARQGISFVGGRGLTMIQCSFCHTGKGTFSTSPGAGIDIEAESAICRDVLLFACEVGNNDGQNFVADSGDSADIRAIDCRFYGTTGYAVWPNKPRMTFDGCRFSGTVLGNYTASNRKDMTRFRNCTFISESFQGLGIYGTGLIDFAAAVITEDCIFHTTNSSIRLGSSVSTCEWRDNSFRQDGSATASSITGEFYGRNVFAMATGSNDFVGYKNFGRILVSGTVASVNVVNGEVGAQTPAVQVRYSMGLDSSNFKTNLTRRHIQAPTSGPYSGIAYSRGDTFENCEPALGGVERWVCTASGTSGTWQPVGIIGGVQASGLSSSSTAADIVAALKAANLAS